MSLPTTPRSKKILVLAEKIAREMGNTYVGTEHILFALFRLKEGTGHGILIASGADENVARKEFEYWNDPMKKLREENAELRAKIASLEKTEDERGL